MHLFQLEILKWKYWFHWWSFSVLLWYCRGYEPGAHFNAAVFFMAPHVGNLWDPVIACHSMCMYMLIHILLSALIILPVPGNLLCQNFYESGTNHEIYIYRGLLKYYGIFMMWDILYPTHSDHELCYASNVALFPTKYWVVWKWMLTWKLSLCKLSLIYNCTKIIL